MSTQLLLQSRWVMQGGCILGAYEIVPGKSTVYFFLVTDFLGKSTELEPLFTCAFLECTFEVIQLMKENCR